LEGGRSLESILFLSIEKKHFIVFQSNEIFYDVQEVNFRGRTELEKDQGGYGLGVVTPVAGGDILEIRVKINPSSPNVALLKHGCTKISNTKARTNGEK